ncbi:DUF6206 family protein [Streptomyces roseifaciens]|uniref:DUF6206 family protein n=1 Tax=Streptomyces roseifaciens TaxID=1488406 RepID=UPI000717F830|nr:DUF6206 family protein [Streptomyces roseifaciens]
MTFTVPEDDLRELEQQVQHALAAGDPRGLTVLGYGEVTLVLALETARGAFACKRLPVFDGRKRFEAYGRTLDRYIERLRAAGIHVAETRLWHTELPSGRIVGYCVQRTLPVKRLVPHLLHSEGDAWAGDFFTRFLDRVHGCVSPILGLDAQASNWIDLDGELVYLDVTSPLMRDARGRERLDVRLFFTSLPWLLRDPVRIAMSKSIFDKFYTPRGVVLDFLGNLHKEKLAGLIPGFLEQANARITPALTAEEVAKYYKGDASMWELIQRLRKADRAWHLKVRHRPYPFLLPPDVDR